MILVGDTVAQVVLGWEDTLHVGIEDLAHHVAAAAVAKPRALLVGDMPWLTYHLDASDTVRNAAVLVRAGARAVKLEGGSRRVAAVRAIIDAEIPVMGHLGLTPQSVHAMGGYKVQGREASAAGELRRDAEALAAAGCFAIVLEGVPEALAERITAEVDIPTVGIGAGPACDGQVIVLHDLLGLEGASPQVRSPLCRIGQGRHRGGEGLGGRRPGGTVSLRSRVVPRIGGTTRGARPAFVTSDPCHTRLRCSGHGCPPAPGAAGLGYHDVVPYTPAPSEPGPRAPGAGSGGGEAAVRPYEVMVIFDVGLEDGDINASLDRITSLVRDRGGNPGRAERWGRRTFAYELKHRSEGYYVLLEFTADPALVAELDRMLTLDDNVLRHKVLRQPDKQSGRALRAEAKRRDTAARKAARAKAAS